MMPIPISMTESRSDRGQVGTYIRFRLYAIAIMNSSRHVSARLRVYGHYSKHSHVHTGDRIVNKTSGQKRQGLIKTRGEKQGPK